MKTCSCSVSLLQFSVYFIFSINRICDIIIEKEKFTMDYSFMMQDYLFKMISSAKNRFMPDSHGRFSGRRNTGASSKAAVMIPPEIRKIMPNPDPANPFFMASNQAEPAAHEMTARVNPALP